jgi:hypothetical protein
MIILFLKHALDKPRFEAQTLRKYMPSISTMLPKTECGRIVKASRFKRFANSPVLAIKEGTITANINIVCKATAIPIMIPCFA